MTVPDLDTGKELCMRKLLKNWNELLPTVLLLAGAAAVSGGIAMVYPPAGLMAAGAFMVLVSVLLIRGGDETGE